MKTVQFRINSKAHELQVNDNELLIETLRERLGFLGTKESCQEGECGTCTVLIDGKNVLSCLILTASLNDKEVTTIEGLACGSDLHPLQKAFVEKGAIQCGFCTPGMILSSLALLKKKPSPSEKEIAAGLDGNLCRCTGYLKIFEAVKEAAIHMNKETKG